MVIDPARFVRESPEAGAALYVRGKNIALFWNNDAGFGGKRFSIN